MAHHEDPQGKDIGRETMRFLKVLGILKKDPLHAIKLYFRGEIEQAILNTGILGVLIRDPNIINAILESPDFGRGGADIKKLKFLFGDSALTNGSEDQEKWQQLSSAIVAMLKLDTQTFMSNMINKGTKTFENISAGDTTDVFKVGSDYSLSLLMELIFGEAEVDPELMAAWHTVNEKGARLLLTPGLQPWIAKIIWPSLQKAIQQIDDFIAQFIAKNGNYFSEGGRWHKAFEDFDRTVDQEKIAGQIKTLLFAGHETTGAALGWLQYLLIKNPEIFSGITSEIQDKVINDGVVQPSKVTIAQLPRTVEAIYETLRLYPSVWGLNRVAIRDTDTAGYHFTSGTIVRLDLHGGNRDKNIWGDDAEDFKPERMRRGALTEAQRGAFRPFGRGQHKCPGENMALKEMLAFIVALVHSGKTFKIIEATPPPEAIARITLGTASGGYPVQAL